MRGIKRSIYVMLAAVLLAATLPMVALAKPSADAGQPTARLFARIEALVVKIWPFTALRLQPTGPQPGTTSESSGRWVERADATEEIGIDISPVGSAAPPEEMNPSLASEGCVSQHSG